MALHTQSDYDKYYKEASLPDWYSNLISKVDQTSQYGIRNFGETSSRLGATKPEYRGGSIFEKFGTAVNEINELYNFLEESAGMNIPGYEGDQYGGGLEEVARDQLIQANKKLDETLAAFKPKSKDYLAAYALQKNLAPIEGIADLEKDLGVSRQVHPWNFVLGVDNELKGLTDELGGVIRDPSQEQTDKWAATGAFEGEPWQSENPALSIKYKYEDFGLGAGKGKPEPEQKTNWLKTLGLGALGVIPGFGIPLAALVGGADRGMQRDAGFGDWLKGGAEGAITAWGGKQIGNWISKMLPAGAPGAVEAIAGAGEAGTSIYQGSPLADLVQRGGGTEMPFNFSDFLNKSGLNTQDVIGSIWGGGEAVPDLWNISDPLLGGGLPGGVGTGAGVTPGIWERILDIGKDQGKKALTKLLGGDGGGGEGGGGGGGGEGGGDGGGLMDILNDLIGGGEGTGNLLKLLGLGGASYLSGESQEDQRNWLESLYAPQREFQKEELGFYKDVYRPYAESQVDMFEDITKPAVQKQFGLFEDVFEPSTRQMGGMLQADLTSPFSLGSDLEGDIWNKAKERVATQYRKTGREASERFAGGGMLGQGPAEQYFQDLGQQKLKSLEDVAVDQAIWEYGQKYKEKTDRYNRMQSFLGMTPTFQAPSIPKPSVAGYGTPQYTGEQVDWSKLVDLF